MVELEARGRPSQRAWIETVDICKQTSGQFPAVPVVRKNKLFLTERWNIFSHICGDKNRQMRIFS